MPTLQQLRIARNLSQEKLAQLVGVSYGTINRAERGLPIYPSTFALLCKVLETEEITGVNLYSAVQARARRTAEKKQTVM